MGAPGRHEFRRYHEALWDVILGNVFEAGRWEISDPEIEMKVRVIEKRGQFNEVRRDQLATA